MCPYCKVNGRPVIKKKYNKMELVKLKPDDKYYRNEAIVGICRVCKKEFLITSEYKNDDTCPYFCERKFEEVEVVQWKKNLRDTIISSVWTCHWN